jgi:hypothetical protein
MLIFDENYFQKTIFRASKTIFRNYFANTGSVDMVWPDFPLYEKVWKVGIKTTGTTAIKAP